MAKRKRKHDLFGLFATLPTVKLFREDMDEIITILKESCEEVGISDEDYEFDSIEDLMQERGVSIQKLELTGHKPYISISFGSNFTSPVCLYASAQDKGAESVFLKVRERLLARKRWLNYVFNQTSGVTAFLVFAIIAYGPWKSFYLSWLGLLLLAFAILCFFFTDTRYFNSIRLEKTHECQSFWTRNRDRIISGIIVGLITALITTIITFYLTLNYAKK